MDYKQFALAFKDIPTPEKIIHNKSYHYLDDIRGKYVPATPEEEVRQKVIYYLLDVLKVPLEAIRVEYLLSKSILNNNTRADIVINKYDDKKKKWKALCVIECKAPDVTLTTTVFEQAVGYAKSLSADYVVIVNGLHSFCWLYNKEHKDYADRLAALPTYKNMLNYEVKYLDEYEPLKRLEYEELEKGEELYVNELGFLARGKYPDHLPFITNLYECLMFDYSEIPLGTNKYYTLWADYGIRVLHVGNSSGYGYDGEYRSFIIKYNNEEFMVSFSIMGAGDRYNTLLVVLNKDGKEHASLEYNLDQLERRGNAFHFVHNGRIACGAYGAGKAEEVKYLVRKEAPFLIKGDKIDLGWVRNERLLTLRNPEIHSLIDNLIIYALIRDKYREMFIWRKEHESK